MLGTLLLEFLGGFINEKNVECLNAKIFFPNLLGIVDTIIFQLILSLVSKPFEHKHFVTYESLYSRPVSK